MTLSENTCLFLNNFFPKKHRLGRGSTESYSEAQYQWAKNSLGFYQDYINLKDKVVLDAGCGPGGKTVFYSEQGVKSITGIDLDELRINYAKEFGEKKKSIAQFQVGNLAQLPFESNTFDYIMMNDVFEHVDREILEKALLELKRVLKPNGKLCLEFPPWSSYDASHLYDFIYIPWCQVFFSTETLVNVTKKLNPPQPGITKLTHIDHFLELNRITIKESKQLFRKLDFKIIVFKPIILLKFQLLRYLPFFNKYLTRRMVVVLGK